MFVERLHFFVAFRWVSFGFLAFCFVLFGGENSVAARHHAWHDVGSCRSVRCDGVCTSTSCTQAYCCVPLQLCSALSFSDDSGCSEGTDAGLSDFEHEWSLHECSVRTVGLDCSTAA